MKKTILLFLTVSALFFTSEIHAQATNYSGDIWVINYYGATTIVPASGMPVAINIGTNCHLGVTVTVQSSTCSHVFLSFGSWVPGCTMLTSGVDFSATPDISQGPCYPNPSFLNPVSVFKS